MKKLLILILSLLFFSAPFAPAALNAAGQAFQVLKKVDQPPPTQDIQKEAKSGSPSKTKSPQQQVTQQPAAAPGQNVKSTCSPPQICDEAGKNLNLPNYGGTPATNPGQQNVETPAAENQPAAQNPPATPAAGNNIYFVRQQERAYCPPEAEARIGYYEENRNYQTPENALVDGEFKFVTECFVGRSEERGTLLHFAEVSIHCENPLDQPVPIWTPDGDFSSNPQRKITGGYAKKARSYVLSRNGAFPVPVYLTSRGSSTLGEEMRDDPNHYVIRDAYIVMPCLRFPALVAPSVSQ